MRKSTTAFALFSDNFWLEETLPSSDVCPSTFNFIEFPSQMVVKPVGIIEVASYDFS
jgi:hypothetical protein